MEYPSNPGVGETVIVFGLKGQYIVLAAATLVALIVIGVVAGSTRLPVLFVLFILVGVAITALGGIIKINKRFGRHGLMKYIVTKRLPAFVRHTTEIHHIIKINS